MKKSKPVFLLCLLLIFLPFVAEPKETYGKGSQISSFLTKARERGIISPQQLENLLELAEEDGDGVLLANVVDSSENKTSGNGVFMKMYNQLTLLNVLYFSGALLIMGAYTLLMTLAFEHCTGTGLGNVMVAQATAFGIVGIYLWGTEYQFLGGLLVSVSTSLVPYTVYCYERALNLWPGDDPGSFMDFRLWIRSGWVVMEVATVVIGFLYLCVVPFPFLLAPVSFALWFLSMDIAPMIPNFSERNAYEVRRNISLVFGFCLLLLGGVMEWLLGSDPDFGFWLYLFGLITFWFALLFYPDNDDSLAISLFLLINICLVLVGSHLDRATFHLFGTVGVALSVHSFLFRRDRFEPNFVLWILKALAAISLLANAIKTGGSIEVFNAAVCFVAFNLEGLVYVNRGEGLVWLILLTNLGFVSVLPTFDRPLNFWFFELPSAQLPMSLGSLSICLFHINILGYYRNRFELNLRDIYFLSYRVVVNVLITVVFLFLDQYWWSWVGVVGIPLIALLTQPSHPRHPTSPVNLVSQYALLFLSISIAVFIDSNLFYLVSCLCMGITILFFLSGQSDQRVLACGLSVGLIVLAVPLQSKFMIAIGGIYIFGYLSHLAYNVFKNSVIFPLALIGLGIGLIYIGVMYQMYQSILYQLSVSIFPVSTVETLRMYVWDISWQPSIRNATFSNIVLRDLPIWLLWPGPMIHALSKEPVPYAGYGCGLGIIIMLLGMVYLKIIKSRCPDLTEQVEVSNLKMSLAHSAGSGIIVEISGTKPVNLDQPRYISMNIHGEMFWKVMDQKFGSLPVKLIRSAFLPYQLTPSLITFNGFKIGSNTFTAIIELGTGKGKSPISHKTIINNCRKIQKSHTPLCCVLMYSNAVYLPYALLSKYNCSIDEICEMLDENYQN